MFEMATPPERADALPPGEWNWLVSESDINADFEALRSWLDAYESGTFFSSASEPELKEAFLLFERYKASIRRQAEWAEKRAAWLYRQPVSERRDFEMGELRTFADVFLRYQADLLKRTDEEWTHARKNFFGRAFDQIFTGIAAAVTWIFEIIGRILGALVSGAASAIGTGGLIIGGVIAAIVAALWLSKRKREKG